MLSLVSFIRMNWQLVAIAAYAAFLLLTHFYAFRLGGKLERAEVTRAALRARGQGLGGPAHPLLRDQQP